MIRYTLTAVFCWVMLVSCASETSVDDLKSFLRNSEHGLIQSVSSAGFEITVAYRPTDIWVYNDLRGARYTDSTVESLRRKYDKYYYFLLSLSKGGKEALQTSSIDNYADVLRTMSFRMPEFVTLTTSARDTTYVADFMLDRTNSMAHSTDILFAFERSDVRAEHLRFNLAEFGLGAGELHFNFQTEDMMSTPQIDFVVEK